MLRRGRVPLAAQQALLDSEPDNVAVWLRAMAWARSRDDDAAMEAAFHGAASATRFDTHRGATMLAIMEGFAGLPTPERCMDPRVQEMAREKLPAERTLDAGTFVQLMGMAREHASVFPGTMLREICSVGGDNALTEKRNAECTHVLTAMAGGEMSIDRYFAMAQLIELTGDTPAGMEWRERYRQLRWMMEQGRQDAPRLDLGTMASGEVAAYEAALRANGRWPPPADWLPGDERSRSLIQTGRPPPDSNP